MNTSFRRLMQDATRLVRRGELRTATAVIQAALRGTAAQASAAAARPPTAGGTVIDAQAREVASPTALPEAPFADMPLSARTPEGTFEAGRFSNGRAQRDYKLFVPPGAGQRPMPLVVMLHGCTQDPDDFARGTGMNEVAGLQGCFVLYPAQAAQANPHRCWNWFKHSHQERGRGEPALLAAMTQHVMAGHRVDPARVYVAGLSAGGAMAAILGAAYPDLYAAVGVHSGLASGAAKDLPSALSAMRSGGAGTAAGVPGLPTIVFHGDADATVHPDNGGHVITASAGGLDAAPHVHQQRAAGGRDYTRRVHRSGTGEVLAEHWVVHGSGHAWSGGSRNGSFTDPTGPDATREMLRFFLEHPRTSLG